uniref:VHL domain-containing protein n=1 Tax=Steinernema glaseri TaxID=37863 RepID=A0A1I7Z9I2_9BILA
MAHCRLLSAFHQLLPRATALPRCRHQSTIASARTARVNKLVKFENDQANRIVVAHWENARTAHVNKLVKFENDQANRIVVAHWENGKQMVSVRFT